MKFSALPCCANLSCLVLALAVIVGHLVGCGGGDSRPSNPDSVLRLAVTTSTRDSGLLDELLPGFEREHNVRVDVIAVGTGKALELGENGDVDAILVHARAAEEAFMQAGHGIRREDVMQNMFEILGPVSDPAGVRGKQAVEALAAIAAKKARFVSRGDESGTHKRELLLWKAGGLNPDWKDYVETGQGMGNTLVIADQMQAYVLSDRGTYLKFGKKIRLVPLAASSELLLNPYGAIVVNPAKHPRINDRLAGQFVDFLVSPKTQQKIHNFSIEGEQLFEPLRLDDN